jgi:hypothetical protein
MFYYFTFDFLKLHQKFQFKSSYLLHLGFLFLILKKLFILLKYLFNLLGYFILDF